MTSRYKKDQKYINHNDASARGSSFRLNDPKSIYYTTDEDSDDDEELFRPHLDLSQKSTRTTSTCDSTNTVEPAATAKGVLSTAVSPETIETQAKRKAQLYVASSKAFAEITHPSMLKWACIKKKHHPCFVHPRPEQRISGTDLQKPSSSNHRLVVFLGRKSIDSDKIQFVSERQLEPYNQNYHNNHDDPVSSSYPDEWNPKFMQSYMKQISNHSVFGKQNNDSGLELRTEYWVLQYLVQSVLERHKRQQQQNDQQNQEKNDAIENSDNEDTSSPKSPPPSPKNEPPTPVFHRQSSWTQTDAMNGKENQIDSFPRQKLRPGDVIEYNLPVSVACKDTIRIGTIVEVHTGRENVDTALRLDNGMFLSKSHYAILRQRYLRGKLQDNPHPVRMAIGDYELTRGVLPDNVVETLASKTKRIFQQARDEIEALQNNQSNKADNSVHRSVKEHENDQNVKETKNSHLDSQRENSSSSSSSLSLRARQNPLISVPGSKKHEQKVPQDALESKAPSPVRSKRERTSPEQAKRQNDMTCGDQGLSKKTKTKQASEHQQLPERQPVPQQSEEPPWKRHLDQQLEKNAEQRKMRRYNAEKVDAVEEALKVAIQVRFRMDEIADREDAYVEHIIEHLLEGAMEDYTAKRLWDYLTGDPNNLISLRERKEMTEEWKEWLDETAPDSL